MVSETQPQGEASPSPAQRRTMQYSYNSVQTTEPVVALTFDDGPHATNTPKLLDLLKSKGVKATFFVVGQNVQEYPDIARRIVAEGHEIANHSWSHVAYTRISEASARSQTQRTQEAIKKATGVDAANFRPPYGAITAGQKKWLYEDYQLRTIIWSVDPFDWKRPGSSVVAQRLISGAHPGAILLVHDIHAPTIAAMPRTLDGLLERGYRFVTVSELLAMDQ
jgi:peptidoglycan/xylan/chitin deacetylase (PgdA/CDA1 family)